MAETQLDIPLDCKIVRSGQYRGWVELPRFALVDDHTYYDLETQIGPDGKEEEKPVPVTLNAQELSRIANECNKRIGESGDYTVICIGHTKDHLPTKFQPDMVGLAKDFAVQPFINPETNQPVLDDTGKPKIAIYATPFCKPENIQKFLEYPRRSIELRFREGELDPISLLGAEAPARYLGLHKFSAESDKSRSKPYVYEIHDTDKNSPETKPMPVEMADGTKPSDGAPDGGTDPYAAVFEDDRFKKVEATCNKLDSLLPQLEQFLAQATGGGEEEPPAGEGAEPFDPNQVGEGDLSMGGDQTAAPMGEDDLLGPSAGAPQGGDDTGLDQDPTHRSSAAMCAPGAMNTFVPAPEKHKGTTRMSATEQVVAPTIDQSKIDAAVKQSVARQTTARFSKLEQENAELKRRLDVVTEERELAQVQGLLSSLDADGYPYDPAIEIPSLIRMSNEERQKRLDYIRKYHAKKDKVLGGGKFPVMPGQDATVRFANALQPQVVNPDDFSSREEALECAREAAATRKTPKEVLRARRGTIAPSANGAVTQVR